MTATVQTIKQVIANLRATPALIAELADTTDLVNEVGLDSLELLQFMLEIEAKLSIRIDFEKLEFSHLNSIRVLADFFDTMPPRRTDRGVS